MRSAEALRILGDITSSQWGMVTSAQAGALGISRVDLSRLADSRHITRLSHGVYKHAAAPTTEHEELRAAWLSTDRKVMAAERLRDPADGVVVAGASAARLHEMGDLWGDRHDFVVPCRRQSQRSEIRYRQRALRAGDVTIVEGLPVMTPERTIADLAEEVGDLSLVADAVRDAAARRPLDLEMLRQLLAPLAGRAGFTRDDGRALLERLLQGAGVDAETLARRIATDARLGPLVNAYYIDRWTRCGRDCVATVMADTSASDEEDEDHHFA